MKIIGNTVCRIAGYRLTVEKEAVGYSYSIINATMAIRTSTGHADKECAELFGRRALYCINLADRL